MEFAKKSYETYKSYHRAAYPYAPVPTFEEWYQISFDTSNQLNLPGVASQVTQHSTPNSPCFDSEEKAEKEPTSSKRVAKRETWPDIQTNVLVESWKEYFLDLETFKQPSAWLKVKDKVDSAGPEKSMKQIKTKLRNMKDSYRQAKDNNKKTGSSPQFPKYYHVFDEILGNRDVMSLHYVKESQ